jgi:hypothetical protein
MKTDITAFKIFAENKGKVVKLLCLLNSQITHSSD